MIVEEEWMRDRDQLEDYLSNKLVVKEIMTFSRLQKAAGGSEN